MRGKWIFAQDPITGKGGRSNADCIDCHVVGEQDLQHIAVAGGAVHFAAIADDKNNPAAGFVPFAQVHGSLQDRVIEHVGFLRRGLDHAGRIGIDRNAIDHGPLRTHRAIESRRARCWSRLHT